MSNPFDKAARYAARLDPAGFVAWLLGLDASRFRFAGWLDTRGVVLPGESDQTADTVARLEDPASGGMPWVVPIEFQIAPDPEMFGRFLEFLGKLWRTFRPDVERGSRYCLGAVVVNLTGRGDASRLMEWAEAGLKLELRLAERNLSQIDAAATLDAIADGKVTQAVLPWIALMQGGGEDGIIKRWKELAGAEPDSRKRSDYGALALVFSEAADRRPAWAEALKEWNMIQSQTVLEWMAQGEAKGRSEGRIASLLRILRLRFGPVPQEVETVIRRTQDVDTLDRWTDAAVTSADLDTFRRTTAL